MHSNVSHGAIVQCLQDELTPGRLGKRFHDGAKAVLLEDPRASDIWHGLLNPKAPATSATGRGLFPSDSGLLEMAQNHLTGNLDAGDMLRFIPGGIGHIARKITLFPALDGSIETIPAHIAHVEMPQELLNTVWELMTDVLHSTFPAQSPLPPYVVTIEMLKYPLSFDEVEQIAELLSDASGVWTRLAMKMDVWKVQATGPFAIRYLREIFALASLIPGLHKLLYTVNSWMTPFTHQHVPEGTRIIGDPHYDVSKIVTALLSERETLTTEIHTGKQWIELPLDSERLAIFPSQQIDPHFGILPTLHRILVQNHTPIEPPTKPNLTLCLTVRPC